MTTSGTYRPECVPMRLLPILSALLAAVLLVLFAPCARAAETESAAAALQRLRGELAQDEALLREAQAQPPGPEKAEMVRLANEAIADRRRAIADAERRADLERRRQAGPADGPRTDSPTDWAASITDRDVAPIARRLASVVPPPPISREQASLDWKQVYLNGDRLEKTGDLVVAGWEMAGLVEKISVGTKGLMIFGKGLIGDLDGAYVYAVKKDQTYDAALSYLKNPSQAQAFARAVDALRHNRPLPPGSDPGMVKAARLIADPRNGSVGWAVWDAMTSREALSAALRKASIEAASGLISYGVGKRTNGFFASMEERKALYDSIRLERTAARKMLDLPDLSAAKKEQLESVIRRADRLGADIYRMDPVVKRVKEGFSGIAIGEATNKMAEMILGPAAKGREY